ncbi:unnamed protein product [Rotaria sp. Silwood2]|nr:unnamed protein product [Rotaria sp. Silwood2]CAF2748000.1 unnamed protein product [Rotaria sp. Silwood2]CAF3020970.1 unnamed protein product [Rotaria sp. Silwood2]CAF3934147.1 unnamed protein product [Rotaria sp. Silwood2]CAF4043093.1 unnamed protein product [Rotaria sp. Silwood2]
MAYGSSVIPAFRIGTVNVHLFMHPVTCRSNAKELASILGSLNLDVLAVEEVKNDYDWTLLCNDLGLGHSVFGASHRLSYGNAIASRHPIIEHSNQTSKRDFDGGYRAMLQCRFGGSHPFVQNRRFAVTHLDHLNEDDRLIQIKEFSPHSHNINVLVGDMNSLTQNDYSNKYFREAVAEKRKKAEWEMPRFELTQLLTDTWGFQDAFRYVNPKLQDKQVATCPYGTRIDYIFLHPLSNDEWSLKECFIVDTYQATDHNAVVATFEHKSKSENNIEK